jgi:tellurite resistance protein TerC
MVLDAGVLYIIIQLILLEGILSIDNAAVLGAMVSVLPNDEVVPYPRLLRGLQRWTDRYLGMQRLAALKVGLLGAYLGRTLMLALANLIIHNPWLRALGAAYLIKLAFENLAAGDQPGETVDLEAHRIRAKTFWSVVLNVELADLAFSLDNVVAAVALSRKFWVVVVGVGLGILTMRFAAGLFTLLIAREPVLVTAAYIIVLNIGAELLLAEFFHIEFHDVQKFMISLGTLLVCVIGVRLQFLHPPLRPVLRWLQQGMGNVDELINWALLPLTEGLRWAGRGLVALGQRLFPLAQPSPSLAGDAVETCPSSSPTGTDDPK